MPPSNGRTSEDSTKPPHVHRDHSSTTHTIHTPLSGSSPSRTACTLHHQLKMFQLRLSLPAWSAPTCPIATRPQSPRLHLKKRFSLVRTTLPDLSASAMALAASPVPSAAPAARLGWSVKEPCALEALAVAGAWAGGGSVQRVLVRFYIQVNRALGAGMAAQPLQLPIGRGLQVLISRSTHSLT